MKYEVTLYDNANNKAKLKCDSYVLNKEGNFLNVYWFINNHVNWRTFAFKDLKRIKIVRKEILEDLKLWPLHFTRTINQ